jgi:crotonobetainyl-CoA:carnitine CoA-transferase CaiB-like acyl-CoA transferase
MPDAGLLDGLRVLDVCDESGALAGRILADLGADVVVAEPPGGAVLRRAPHLGGEPTAAPDPERSLAWLSQQTGKRGITLDLDQRSGRERLRELAAWADVVVETFAPGFLHGLGLDHADLAAEHPRLVWCSITPFGRSGPYANWKAGDLSIVAMGGNLAMTGEPDHPPVRCSLPTAYFHGGPEAVIGILFALHAREATGRGQLVDVSLHETQLQTLITGASQHAWRPGRAKRVGAKMGRTNEIWRTRDGMVSFGLRGGAARIPNLRATVAYMAEHGMAPDWLRDHDWERYSHLEAKDADIARLEQAFGAFFASRTLGELYEQALARRILLAPCNDARAIVSHAQLRSRGFFTRVEYPELGASLEHPDFFAVTEPHPVHVRRRAPRLGEHDAELDRELAELAPARPFLGASASRLAPPVPVFAGLHVLEIGSGAAGPIATKYLAEHGAKVIRIESSRRPDFLRVLFLTSDSRFGPDGSPMFVLLNPDKQSLTLDLKQPEARALARRLVAWADVLCENYAPGVLERFGLDAVQAREINPRLVYASGCLFGQTGPQRHYPGYGGQGSAIAGFNHLTGRPDGPAHGPYATITDSLAPRYVAVAIAAALWRRERTGEGAAIDLSQIEAGVYSLAELVVRFSATGEVMSRRANRSEHAAPHGVYPCAGDDRWIAIAIAGDAEWRALVREMGDPAWANAFAGTGDRLADQDALDARIGAWTRSFEPQALAGRLQRAGIDAAPVQTFDDLLADPQLAHREHWVPLVHGNLGELLFERSGFRLSAARGGFSRPGPNLGEHSAEILREVLGLSDAEISRLIESGVVA